jgi:hypothetical protein
MEIHRLFPVGFLAGGHGHGVAIIIVLAYSQQFVLNGEEGVGDSRIEVGAAPGADNIERLIQGKGLLVGAMPLTES